MVQKARAPIDNLPQYVLGIYLPTLLWGSVLDAWITANPLLKYRPDDLSGQEKGIGIRSEEMVGRMQF
jgi:hypothetical protein